MSAKLRYPAYLLVCVLSVFSLTACGLFGAEPTPTPEPVDVSFLTYDLAGLWGRAEQLLVDQFQASHPYAVVDRHPYGRSQGPRDYLSLAPQPDIMVITAGYQLDSVIAQRQLVDMTDLWDQSGLTASYPPGFQRLSEREGKQYFAPIGYAWTGLYYSRPLFEQLGLQPPTTWDELLTTCATLQANGIIPITLPGRDPWLAMLWFDYLDLRLNGPDFHHQLVSGEISYEDPQVLAVLDLWSQLLANGCFIERPQSVDSLEAHTLVATDDPNLNRGMKAAMVLTNPSWLGDVPAPMRANLGFVPFPAIDPSIPDSEIVLTYGYMVPLGAPQRDLATEFAKMAVSADAQSNLAQQINGAEALLAPANLGSDQTWMNDGLRSGMVLVQQAQDVFPPFMLGIPDSMWQRVQQGLNGFLNDPGDILSFAGALEAAREKAQDADLFITAD